MSETLAKKIVKPYSGLIRTARG